MNTLFPLDTSGNTRASYTRYYLAAERGSLDLEFHSADIQAGRIRRKSNAGA